MDVHVHSDQVGSRLCSGQNASTSSTRPLSAAGSRRRGCDAFPARWISGRRRDISSGSSAVPAGGGPGSGGTGGSSGFGGDNGGESESEPSKQTFLSGWEARVAADPQFVYKVLVEQIIGVGAAVLGDMSSRPYWGLFELDFVFSTLVVGSLLNFSLMYLLAPTAGAASVSKGLVASLFSESTLKSWGAPGGHMFEAGFPAGARAVNLAYKGAVFAFVGLAAGIVGTALSNGLIAVRKVLDPKFEQQNALPSIPLNAACWATHMGLSSNLRYQLINGLETALQPRMGAVPFRLLTSAVRTGNNIVGGVSFVLLAKVLGIQHSQGDEVKEQQKAETGAESD